MNYTKEYFIEKFNSIPDENWLADGNLQDYTKENCGCALFHCGVREVFPIPDGLRKYVQSEEANALIKIFGGSEKGYGDYALVYRINDNAYSKGLTPKQAIIKKLESL